LKICWNEKISRKKKIYIVEKKKYFNRNEGTLEAIEDWRNKRLNIIGIIIKRESGKQGVHSETRKQK